MKLVQTHSAQTGSLAYSADFDLSDFTWTTEASDDLAIEIAPEPQVRKLYPQRRQPLPLVAMTTLPVLAGCTNEIIEPHETLMDVQPLSISGGSVFWGLVTASAIVGAYVFASSQNWIPSIKRTKESPEKIPSRFIETTNSTAEATNYFKARAKQLLIDGYKWMENVEEVLVEPSGIGSDLTETPWCARTYYKHEATGKIYQAIFVYEDYMHQGFYSAYIKDLGKNMMSPIITIPDCKIERFLRKRGAPHVVAGHFTETTEYKMISAYYGDQKAERSGVYYMNHIDEGLYILRQLGASERAMRAYCLHPLMQGDTDLVQTFSGDLSGIDAEILVLAMEYRNIANAYLSRREIHSLNDIALSPLEDVNMMLRADKIQNYKDFLRYHADSHPRRVQLEEYFLNWLSKLGLSLDLFWKLSQNIDGLHHGDVFETADDSLKTEIILATQINLVRENDEGELEFYLQQRAPGMRSFRNMWCSMGGQAEPGQTTRQTAITEASEEGAVSLVGRKLILLRGSRTKPIVRKGKDGVTTVNRIYVMPIYLADGRGLNPRIDQAKDEVQKHGWFTIKKALAMHAEAVAKHPDADPSNIPGGIPPRMLETLHALNDLPEGHTVDSLLVSLN